MFTTWPGRSPDRQVVFASDSGTVMSGFWLKDLEVKSNGQAPLDGVAPGEMCMR